MPAQKNYFYSAFLLLFSCDLQHYTYSALFLSLHFTTEIVWGFA
jgi:hypothetical protein